MHTQQHSQNFPHFLLFIKRKLSCTLLSLSHTIFPFSNLWPKEVFSSHWHTLFLGVPCSVVCLGNFHRLAFHWHMLFLGIPYSMVCPWETYGFNSHWHIFSRHLMFYILPEGNFHRFTSHWHTVFLCIPVLRSARGKLLLIHFSLAHSFPVHPSSTFCQRETFIDSLLTGTQFSYASHALCPVEENSYRFTFHWHTLFLGIPCSTFCPMETFCVCVSFSCPWVSWCLPPPPPPSSASPEFCNSTDARVKLTTQQHQHKGEIDNTTAPTQGQN